MSLQLVRASEPTPSVLMKSVFLTGVSPRADEDADWLLSAVEAFRAAGFDGTLFLPTWLDETSPEADVAQWEWNQKHQALADVIAFWCDPNQERSPGDAASIEFGEWFDSGKLVYGRREASPGTGAFDLHYGSRWSSPMGIQSLPCSTLDELAWQCVERLGEGAERCGGERAVPLSVWRSPQFQAWYRDVVAAGNQLDDAKVLWSYQSPQSTVVFCFSLWVKVWVAGEERHKENEFIVSRPDVSSVCAYSPRAGCNPLETKVVLIREFRSSARSADGFLHDLPGGSSIHEDEDPIAAAVREFEEETGVQIAAARIRTISSRQVTGSFATHRAHLFSLELTSDELEKFETLERSGAALGVASDSEKTRVAVRTIRQILDAELVDHATIGMLFQACLAPSQDRNQARRLGHT